MSRIIKTQVTAKSKKLSAQWTIEPAQDVVSIYGDAENEIAAILAADIQEEIDWEILKTLALDNGWTEIEFTESALVAGKEKIRAWATEQFGRGFMARRDRIMIEREEHAVLFALRWL